MKIICLDVGEKRIGVARADSATRIAVPIGFIEVNGTEWQEINRIARINSTNLFVLGLPRSNDGNETKQSLYVRNFAKTLASKIPGIKIRFQDESLTSVTAEERLKARKKKYEKGEIDAEAASIILQDFLENLKNLSDITASGEKKVANNAKKTNPSNKATYFVKNTAKEVGETVTGITKKEAKKVQLNTRIVKHKMKSSTKALISLIVLAVVIGGAVGGVFLVKYIKDERARARAEEYARQEAEMKAATFDFTIKPGETIFDIKKNLLNVDRNGNSDKPDEERLENYTQTEIDEAFKATYDYPFLEDLPDGASLEGFLYPETLNFYSESSVSEILDAFLAEMDRVILENGLIEMYQQQGLSLFQGVTLASVVQKEAASPEQPTVAQVFLSRLNLGIPMGSDVTVSYALDVVDPERQIYRDNSAALLIDSCYNTRLHGGLPCGPISNPGLNALLAVANPSDTTYLYFLTGDDGLMYYSYTEYEHNQNIYRHCQKLCNVAL
ncbi:endolytic transglycosylase MltG [Candidatus Saccharibacteria bacterium]|nr:endolytic transglycosylase MltG [Candidatus Saccharibacteria bacterium]